MQTAFEICIHCRCTLEFHAPWVIEEDESYPTHTTYRAVFDHTVSPGEIAAAISTTLDTPLVQVRSNTVS